MKPKRKGKTEMKKNILRVGVLVVVLAILLLGISPVSARTRITLTYTQEVVGVLDPGVVTTFPNGDIHIRGMVLALHDEASDPHLIGNARTVVNENLDVNGDGTGWGTSHFMSDEGGMWDLVWVGRIENQQPVSLTGVGFGSQLYRGFLLWCEISTATVIGP
jgi:hypothetical protein